MKAPIFLFSLPRSGSTLLQRILMGHPRIKSIAEPWLLLPLVYIAKKEGILSEYSHNLFYQAFSDFIQNMPNKEKDYLSHVATFANSLYSEYCPSNNDYFLDKTPRYYLIIPEIAKMFPDAKFIFLFRNPVQIYGSIINTWQANRLMGLHHNYIDLTTGPEKIAIGYNLLKGRSYALKYEDFVKYPKRYLEEICRYLEIDYAKKMLDNFPSQNTKGKLGDPSGIKAYKQVTSDPINKWKYVFYNRFRQRILWKYIQRIGSHVFESQGYEKKDILKDILQLTVSNRGVFRDILDYQYSLFVRKINLNVLLFRKFRWSRRKYFS